MPYRQLTSDECVAYVAANAAVVEWAAIQRLALAFFGPSAVVVEAVIDWRYVDDAGSIYERPDGLKGLLAFDAAGAALQPDLTLPFWQAHAGEFSADEPGTIADIMYDACQNLDNHLIQGLRDITEPANKRYDLTRPPLTPMALYALEP